MLTDSSQENGQSSFKDKKIALGRVSDLGTTSQLVRGHMETDLGFLTSEPVFSLHLIGKKYIFKRHMENETNWNIEFIS